MSSRAPVAACAATLLLSACGGSHARPTAGRGQSCAPAPILHRAPPPWSAAAWSDSSGFAAPYALASDDAAAAFFFTPALRAGHPTDPANKVLWVVRFPRDGHPLVITARLGADPATTVRITRPADSSPGEIYPSYVDLPRPGCWRLALAWGSHRAHIDVQVRRLARALSNAAAATAPTIASPA